MDFSFEVQRNRKEDAAKAAKTRHKSRQTVQEQYKCGVCQAVFEETEESGMWIGCEECDTWFHWTRVGITIEPDIHMYHMLS